MRTATRTALMATTLAIAACSSAVTDNEPAQALPAASEPAATALAAPTTTATTTAAAVTTPKPALIEMPDLAGLPNSLARRALRDAGFTGIIDSPRPLIGETAGPLVTGQDPPAGTLHPADNKVTLEVELDPVPETTIEEEPEDERTESGVPRTSPATPPADPDPILASIATPGWLEANNAVSVDSTGLMWVPWPAFGPDADAQLRAERDRWAKTMPPLLGWVESAIANGEPIAREKADKPGSWHSIVDKTDLDIHYIERGNNVSEEIQVCPQRLGESTPQTQKRRDEMLAPGGLRIHAVGDVINSMGALLAFSPGEPMSIAGLRYLADQGFVPGDWSAEALEVLVRRAAVAAVIEELVPRAAMSTASESLWAACMDAASTASRSNRRSGSWGITLQALWTSGLRLEHTAPPPDRVWIEAIEAGARVGVIVCRAAETVHLVDVSTGRRVGVFEERAEAARALHLSWGGDRFRTHQFESFEGRCAPGSAAWDKAVDQLGAWADEAAATVDLDRWWALGIRQTWLRVGQWVNVPQEVAWEAHRSAGLDLRLWCAIGPPIRDPFDAGEIRDNVRPHCTTEQRARMLDQVATAPAYTAAMSGFAMPVGTPWAQRNQHPLRGKAEVLGCDPTDGQIATDQRNRAVEPSLKRPWPPGLLAGGPADGWPSPAVPCPGVAWPSFDDGRFWWPQSMATGYGARKGG